MNKKEHMYVKAIASFAEIIPDGNSREAVRGFKMSYFWSAHLLKAMAADLANTIQKNTLTAMVQSIAKLTFSNPSVKPIAAKGKANTVWLNFINDK